MKRSLWATPLLLVLISGTSLANIITTISLVPNDGTGENLGFSQTAPGFSVGLSGGTPVSFFGIEGFAPGTTLGGVTDVFFDGGFAVINGVGHELDLSGGSLFMSSITLPTNGAIQVTFPVQLELSASGAFADTGDSFDVDGGASGTITFDLDNGVYYPEGFVQKPVTTTPEPSTVSLMAVGLICVFGLIGKRRNCFRS